jgi:DNA-binding NarL/FixJ family response regulator
VVECYHHGTAAIILQHRGADSGRHLGAADPFAAQIGKRVIYTLALARSLQREQADQPAHALAELRDALAQSAEEPAETAALLADAVRLALREGDRAGAEDAAARAEALTQGSEQLYRSATAAHCRGLIARDAAQLIQAALGYETIGRSLPRAQALEAAAVTLADAGDVPAARQCYNDAFAGYQDLGAAWDLARIQATFRAYGIRRGPAVKHRRVDHGWDSLTPTEHKVVDLVALGLSNPQIAAQLFLSPRTVQSHVSHILSKLKLQSRMDIAREATLRDR